MTEWIVPKIPEGIFQLGSCAHVKGKSPEWIKEWASKGLEVQQSATCEIDGGSQRIFLDIEQCAEDSIHFHLEIYRHDVPVGDDQLEEDYEAVDFEKLSATVLGFMKMVEGDKAKGSSRARLVAPVSNLPSHGPIADLLECQGRPWGKQFRLKQAALEIDHKLFDKMDFLVREKKGVQHAFIQLFASGMLELTPDYLANVVEIMSAGIDTYVYGRVTEEHAHVSSW